MSHRNHISIAVLNGQKQGLLRCSFYVKCEAKDLFTQLLLIVLDMAQARTL